VGRAFKGSLRTSRPDDYAALVIKEALARVPGLDPKEIDDVILGCAMPEGEQGMNVAHRGASCWLAGGDFRHDRESLLRQRDASHCASRRTHSQRRGANNRRRGTSPCLWCPWAATNFSQSWLVDHYPDAYINMGLGTENIARKFGIGREQQINFP
jgi:acetyl-CoA acyltransferase